MSASHFSNLLVAAVVLASAPLCAADEPRMFVGRVVDARGVPIAGVLVEYGRHLDGPDQRESTTTNAVGKYRLATTTVGRGYRLGFSKADFAPQWIEDVIPGPADRPKQLDVQLVAGTRVTVEFRNGAGQPVPGVAFTIATASNGFHSSFSSPTPSTELPGPRREWVTDAAGRATLDDLPAKPLEVHRRQGGQSDNWLQISIRAGSGGYYEQNITEERILGGEPVVVTLPDWQLPRDPAALRGVVRARVIDGETGRPIPHYVATLRHRPQALAVDDPAGVVSYSGKLEIGAEYQVRVFAPGYAVGETMLAAVAPEHAAAPPEIRLDAHPSLEGRLVDAATSEPLARVTIVVGHAPEKAFKYIEWHNLDQYADGHHSLVNVVRVTTDADGRFTAPEAPGQPTNLVVLHPGYERRVFPQTARPVAGADGVTTFALRRASRVTAEAIRQTPAGARATRVSLHFGNLGDGFEHFGISAPLDERGRATFDSLPTGTYRLALEQGRLSASAPSFSRSVSLAAGQHKTVLLGAMPGALRLYGQAPPLASITVTPKFETEFGHFSIQADADGQFELTHLLPGEYSLRVNDSSPASGFIPDEPEITVDLQQDRELDLLTRARRKVLGQ